MKYEWRKKEKEIYLPKNKPEIVIIPSHKFFMIEGKGNPNDDFFPEYIGVLYSLSYGVRMSPKSGVTPDGYFEYTVYPLEGIWDISDEAKKNYSGKLISNKIRLSDHQVKNKRAFIKFATIILFCFVRNIPYSF